MSWALKEKSYLTAGWHMFPFKSFLELNFVQKHFVLSQNLYKKRLLREFKKRQIVAGLVEIVS